VQRGGLVILFIWVAGVFIGYQIDMGHAQGAPQQAAGAAMACVSLIFPYILFRIISFEGTATSQKKTIELLERILEIQNHSEAAQVMKQLELTKLEKEIADQGTKKKPFIKWW
jgi:hypothetical protein